MNELTKAELQKAFHLWRRSYGASKSDEFLKPFLDITIKGSSKNEGVDQKGWLRRTRLGLFLSASTVAKKLNVSRAAYSKYEEAEESGVITIGTLARAAEAMDCELIYAIRPKSRKYFINIIWEQLLRKAVYHPWIKKCDQKRKAQAVAAIAKKIMEDPKFRREQGWSQRANQ